jgi:hypothetical protein
LNVVEQNSAGENRKKSSINIDKIAILVIIIVIQIIIDKFQVCPVWESTMTCDLPSSRRV